jgi:hypothetical protein
MAPASPRTASSAGASDGRRCIPTRNAAPRASGAQATRMGCHVPAVLPAAPPLRTLHRVLLVLRYTHAGSQCLQHISPAGPHLLCPSGLPSARRHRLHCEVPAEGRSGFAPTPPVLAPRRTCATHTRPPSMDDPYPHCTWPARSAAAAPRYSSNLGAETPLCM